MKHAVTRQLLLALGLLALWGAPTLAAAQVREAGEEHARQLLSGRGAAPSATTAPTVSLAPIAAAPIAVDGQAQARLMILGRQAMTPVDEVRGARVAGAQRARVAADPHEMARQMIRGGQSTVSPAKIRLTGKPESSRRPTQETP